VEPDAAPQFSSRIGVVTGLASEAVVATAMLGDTSPSVEIVCAGASASRADRLARQLVANGAEALLSFGIAGALAPDLDCGDLVIADGVRSTNGNDYACHAAWRAALSVELARSALPHRQGAVLASARALMLANDKQKAYRDSGCLAVDMESGAVAAVAADAGLPFLAVRAIADRAQDSLPTLVENAVRPDGMPAIGRALAGMIRRPGEIPAVLRLARQSELALARLRMLEAAKAALFGGF
jgi:hopanoid-associated phosphorylase